MRRLAIRAESWPIAGRFTISRGSKAWRRAPAKRSGATLIHAPALTCCHVLTFAPWRHWDREVERALAEEEG
jgi:hypothetical protein